MAISHPIQPSQWAGSRDINDANTQDARTPYDEARTLSSLESARAKFKLSNSINSDPAIEGEELDNSYTPGDDVPTKPVVSVLIPVSHISVNPHEVYGYDDELESDPINVVEVTNKKYGQMLGHPKTPYDAIHGYESEFYSASTPRYSSGHYISFLSYRVSIPLMKFFPAAFPAFPLPGIFTAIIVLLALVWIAIFTIGLVEFGNYLWNGYDEADETGHRTVEDGLEDDSEEYELSEHGEMSKLPLHPVGFPMPVAEGPDDEGSLLMSNTSDSESESGIDNYRVI
ncbi:hypothetical protein N7481_009374 [Penicillium waksmanii]|uniref:uncharacterized protein n=1 Tax=Penicillium waksmanii TaxID=69791 RepID=UPI002547C4A6|nr:uncharacterized protein N7481_009374 [Penicillium waksmanii]KAJ5975667.1 hypothetical protein N7481_009374 [Penicillium waksmanii]